MLGESRSFKQLTMWGNSRHWQSAELLRQCRKISGPRGSSEILFRKASAVLTQRNNWHGGAFLNHLSKNEKLELLRSITAEHQSLKARVRQLEGQIFRSPDDQVEMAELKKRKLLMKDRIRVLECN